MIRTRVGYAGGTTKNPTYHHLGDHTETLQLDYDPAVITYAELLTVFWDSHSPERSAWSRQYMAAAFYHNEMQLEAIEASRAKIASEIKREIKTEVLPFTGFTLAEDYHQKHALRRNSQMLEEFRAMYPKSEDLVASTAAARVNGYLAGYGECDRLKREIDALGLSLEGSRKLLALVCGRKAAMSCPIGGDS